MFLPYKIKKDIVDSLQTYSYETEYEKIRGNILQTVTDDELQKVLIDGSKLQEVWFPTEDMSFNVFLSHSHGDEETAKKLAAYLREAHGLTTFIDSCYWNFCDDLLNKLDRQFWEKSDGEGLFNYEKRNYSTTIIHSMLSISLMKMMSKCECFLLLDSSNVQFQGEDLSNKTKSAWIYQEAEMSKALEKKIPLRWLKHIVNHREGGILETRYFSSDVMVTERQEVTFNLDTNKMHQVDDCLLIKMQGKRDEVAMDVMHNDYMIKQYEDHLLFEKREIARRTVRMMGGRVNRNTFSKIR